MDEVYYIPEEEVTGARALELFDAGMDEDQAIAQSLAEFERWMLYGDPQQ